MECTVCQCWLHRLYFMQIGSVKAANNMTGAQKRLWILSLALVLFVIGLFVYTASQQDGQPIEGAGGVFVSQLPVDFKNLQLADLPSTIGHSAAVHDGNLIIASHRYLMEYTQDGKLVRISDPSVFACPNDDDYYPELPAGIAGEGNTLYAACTGNGLYEINLAENRVVAFWDRELPDLRNLRLTIDGDTLWLETFNGLAKIDRQTRKVTSYREELGITCEGYGTTVSAFKGDVWVTVNANAGCTGGVAHYQPATDSWTFYGVEAFNRIQLDRIDFNKFIVSAEGVFAVHQDGGPEHTILDQFDVATNSWKRLDDQPADIAYKSRLPLPEEYLTSYVYGFDQVITWHVKDGDEWIVLTLPERIYLAMTPVAEGEFVLLSTAGLESFEEGDDFPKMLIAGQQAGGNGRIFSSTAGRYVIGMSDLIGDYGGEWFGTDVTVYDWVGKKGFSTRVVGAETDLPPANGKDLSSISLVEDGDRLLLQDAGVTVLVIDLVNHRAALPTK